MRLYKTASSMAIHSSRQTFSILRTEHIVELIQFIKKMIFLEHVAVIADLKLHSERLAVRVQKIYSLICCFKMHILDVCYVY